MSELQLPAHLTSRKVRAVSTALENLGAGSVPYVSIKGNRFLLIDAAGNEKPAGAMDPKLGLYLDAVIVDSNPHRSKIYYANAYDPSASEFVPPDCFSDNGIGASSQAARPQSKLCASCPHNQWGSETSRLTGRGTKACNDVQKVALLIPGNDMLFLLRVPPASLKHLGRYAMSLKSLSAGGRQVDITELVTRISFDQNAVGILQFNPSDFIDAKTAASIDKVWQNDAAAIMLGKHDKPVEGEVKGAVAQPVAVQRLPPPDAAAIGREAVQQAVEEGPKRPRGRPPKSDKVAVSDNGEEKKAPFLVAQSGGVQADDGPELPAFLDRREGRVEPLNPQPVNPSTPAFGMAEATPAPDDMAARIRAALALPTQ
jgi:hypothetical protein